jgi:CRISPR system Cascade subunit CasA
MGHVERLAGIAMVAVGMAYGPNDSTIADLTGDRLDFTVQLLESGHRHTAVAAAADSDSAATAVVHLAENLHLAAGGDPRAAPTTAAREQAFARLDLPFRAWLRELGLAGDPESLREAWQRTVRAELLGLCGDWLRDVPPRAWIGRKQGTGWASAPQAELRFRAALDGCLPLTHTQQGGHE